MNDIDWETVAKENHSKCTDAYVEILKLEREVKRLKENNQQQGCLSCNGDEWYFNRWCWIDDKGDSNSLKIKFCPLCGRKLEKSI